MWHCVTGWVVWHQQRNRITSKKTWLRKATVRTLNVAMLSVSDSKQFQTLAVSHNKPPKWSFGTSRLLQKKCLSHDFPSFSVHSQQLPSGQNLFSGFHGACSNDGSLFVSWHCVVIIPFCVLTLCSDTILHSGRHMPHMPQGAFTLPGEWNLSKQITEASTLFPE